MLPVHAYSTHRTTYINAYMRWGRKEPREAIRLFIPNINKEYPVHG